MNYPTCKVMLNKDERVQVRLGIVHDPAMPDAYAKALAGQKGRVVVSHTFFAAQDRRSTSVLVRFDPPLSDSGLTIEACWIPRQYVTRTQESESPCH
jgi:hypothetical protein